MKRLLIGAIRVYQVLISPVLGSNCRYIPCCSSYLIGAVEIHGLKKGIRLGLARLLRCHMFHPGGYDPVPERKPCK